ncbi:MAG: hypothetical protein ACRC3H_21730 [Lachnospiraceae bacterium]
MGTKKKTDFYDMVNRLAEEMDSLYTDRQPCRVRIYEFMELNEWFGIEDRAPTERDLITLRKKKWMIPEAKVQMLKDPIRLWLRAYLRTNKEKLLILLEYGNKTWPETSKNYGVFIEQTDMQDEPAAWQLLDFLLAVMEKELLFYPPEEIEGLVRRMSEELSISAASLFAGYLKEIQRKKKEDGWVYKFTSRGNRNRKKLDAYPMKDFAVMAYCIFNKEVWKKQRLLEKACASDTYANLWAFLAMHFICALRGTDIVRIPMIKLPVHGEELREQIRSGIFHKGGALAEELQVRVRYKAMRPNKTKSYDRVPEIKLFIPESLKEPIGIILALAASYCGDREPGSPFLRVSRDIVPIRNFFGAEFAGVLGGRRFSTRKANKSYLQGISLTAETKGQEHPKGYMLAALARSHKGGIGTLPEMTEVYLKDAEFTGYTPEFIAREMFERGIFGFIPYLLLKMYGGKEYAKLPVPAQTELIKTLGMRPAGIEGVIRMVETSMLKAEDSIKAVLSSKGSIAEILQQIATGAAVGKQKGCLCLMTAAGFTCREPGRKACMGCRFEIYTKSTMHLLVKEYVKLNSKQKSEKDGWRYQMMLKKGVLPIMSEMLASIKGLYPEADMDVFAEIMEGGMNGYVGCSQ